MRAWSRAYRDDGLVVVGVHTPEFSFEYEVEGVRHAIASRSIDYPVAVAVAVAVDNDYDVWNAFANGYWPALNFVDRGGVIRDEHFGEGATRSRSACSRSCSGSSLRTPETYLGFSRGENFVASGSLGLNRWSRAGRGTVGHESVMLEQAGEASRTGFTRATPISSWLPRAAARSRSESWSTARHPRTRAASTSTPRAAASCGMAGCTSWCARAGPCGSGRSRSPSSSRAPRARPSPSASELGCPRRKDVCQPTTGVLGGFWPLRMVTDHADT